MGFFDRLFGKGSSDKNEFNFEKIAEMLDEDIYWKIVRAASKKSSDQEAQAEILSLQLQKLSPKEIIGFKLRTDKLL